MSETKRLEAMWAGEFGDAYVERNADAHTGREAFWRERVETLGIASALEIGCNVGGNLRWLATLLGNESVAGVDVNARALEVAREHIPGANLRLTSGRELPFADAAFDLVFTVGVLIHQSQADLPSVIDEMVRCSGRYVLCAEYYAETLEEVPYRGQEGALFKQDYGARIQERHPDLQLLDRTFLGASDDTSWDDVTVWTFAKPA